MGVMHEQGIWQIIVPLGLSLQGGHLHQHLCEYVIEFLQLTICLGMIGSCVLASCPKICRNALG